MNFQTALMLSIRVEETEDLPQWVLKLDKEASGGNRGHVLKILMEGNSRLLTVHEKGYALLRESRIGPLVAKDVDVAKVIIIKAIELGAKSLIVPEANKEAVKLMKEMNAQQRFSCLRMRLGEKRKERTSLIYSIISYAKS